MNWLPDNLFKLHLFGMPAVRIKVPYSRQQVFEIVAQNAELKKRVPWHITKRYGRSDVPYFKGIVDPQKNKIDLLFNPEHSNSLSCIRATVHEETGNSCIVEYECYNPQYPQFWLFIGSVLSLGVSVVSCVQQNWQVAKVTGVAALILFAFNRFFQVMMPNETMEKKFVKIFNLPVSAATRLPETLHKSKS